MPRLGTLYTAMEPRMRRLPRRRPLTAADIVKPTFRLECDRRLEIYYAPMDWLRLAARVAIVGITPGKGTMVIAHQTAVEGLAAGRSPAAILNEVKSRAAFSGFRCPLITCLEYLGVHRHLGLQVGRGAVDARWRTTPAVDERDPLPRVRRWRRLRRTCRPNWHFLLEVRWAIPLPLSSMRSRQFRAARHSDRFGDPGATTLYSPFSER